MSLHLGLLASKMGKIAALLSSSRDNFCDFLQQFLHILAGERAECGAASEKYSLIFQHQGKECRHTISILFKYWNTHLHCVTVWVNSIYRYEAVFECTGHDWQDLLSLHELIESDTDPPLASDWSRVITWPGYWPLIGPDLPWTCVIHIHASKIFDRKIINKLSSWEIFRPR